MSNQKQNSQESPIKLVSKKLKKIRNSSDRYKLYYEVFDLLGYNMELGYKDFKQYKIEAFLIVSVIRVFQTYTNNTDILLIALSLMDGYDHEIIGITDRRIKYLRDSNYLKLQGKSPYDEVNNDEQNDYIDQLRKAEDKLFPDLTSYLYSQGKNIEKLIIENNEYMKKVGTEWIVALPTPYYIKSKRIKSSRNLEIIYTIDGKYNNSVQVPIPISAWAPITIDVPNDFIKDDSTKLKNNKLYKGLCTILCLCIFLLPLAGAGIGACLKGLNAAEYVHEGTVSKSPLISSVPAVSGNNINDVPVDGEPAY